MNTVGSAMEIHRLLDAAFAGIEVTPDVQDLKEEMRANLVVRVEELERDGVPTEVAAQRAMAELGDIRSVVGELETVVGRTSPWTRNKVRPKPAFVVRTVVLSVLGAGALATLVVPAFGPSVTLASQVIAIVGLALAGGVIVADSLRQETTTNYPVPRKRAVGYGVATVLALAGAGAVVLWLRDQPLPWVVGGGLMLLLGVIGFTYLGATQTNRHKAWALQLQAAHEEVGDRFTQDPAAAARFGIYTLTIWLVAFAAFGVLTFTIGWAWSWLALLGGVVAMMMTLARMLFVSTTVDRG